MLPRIPPPTTDRPRRIRVVQILEATTGGTRRHLDLLLSRLDPTRFEVTLIYSNRRDPYFANDLRRFAALGIELHEAPMHRSIRPLADLWAFIRIWRLLACGRFDIVHTHSSKAGFLGRLAARLAGGSAVLYSPHGFAFQYRPGSWSGRLYRALERLAGHWHDILICVSPSERQVAQRHRITHSRIEVIPNALAPRGPTDEDVRRRHGIPSQAWVVGVVAQFRPQKGYQHFIDAIPAIASRCPGVHFLLVGDGPLRPVVERSLERLGVRDIVTLAGHREDPADYYRAMDLFVLASLWEGMPYAILEAMAAGLAIVATDAVGNRDLVTDGINGYLVPTGSSVAIAQRVTELLWDAPRRERMGRAGCRWLAAQPGIEAWTTRYEHLYTELFNARHDLTHAVPRTKPFFAKTAP